MASSSLLFVIFITLQLSYQNDGYQFKFSHMSFQGDFEQSLQELLTAAQYGDIAHMETLLNDNLGLGVNDRNEMGETALMIAAANNEVNAVKWLIEVPRARLEIRDSDSQTALMHAVKRNLFASAQALLLRGANPNAVDVWGAVPLMYAVNSGYTALLELLLEHGGDIYAKTRYGNWAGLNPLTLAQSQNRADFVRRMSRSDLNIRFFLLKQPSINWDQALMKCAEKNARLAHVKNQQHLEAIRKLLANHTVNVNPADADCTGFWLGARTEQPRSSPFLWAGDKSPVTVLNWENSQPDFQGCNSDNSRNNQQIIPYCVVATLRQARWDDEACSYANDMSGAICEYF